MNNRIYFFIGKSGTGKNTVADLLHEKHGWTVVEPFATRQPRFEGEKGYKFITKKEFDSLPNKCVDKSEYCITHEQIETADICIVSPTELAAIMKNYKGSKDLIAIHFICGDGMLKRRLLQRSGATVATVEQQMKKNKSTFRGVDRQLNRYDELTILNIHTDSDTPDETVKLIMTYDNV